MKKKRKKKVTDVEKIKENKNAKKKKTNC